MPLLAPGFRGLPEMRTEGANEIAGRGEPAGPSNLLAGQRALAQQVDSAFKTQPVDVNREMLTGGHTEEI